MLPSGLKEFVNLDCRSHVNYIYYFLRSGFFITCKNQDTLPIIQGIPQNLKETWETSRVRTVQCCLKRISQRLYVFWYLLVFLTICSELTKCQSSEMYLFYHYIAKTRMIWAEKWHNQNQNQRNSICTHWKFGKSLVWAL